jgi:hypothetical protein
LPDFSCFQKPKLGTNLTKGPQQYQIDIKYWYQNSNKNTKIAIKIPKGLKVTKFFHPKAFHTIPKLVYIFGLWQP